MRVTGTSSAASPETKAARTSVMPCPVGKEILRAMLPDPSPVCRTETGIEIDTLSPADTVPVADPAPLTFPSASQVVAEAEKVPGNTSTKLAVDPAARFDAVVIVPRESVRTTVYVETREEAGAVAAREEEELPRPIETVPQDSEFFPLPSSVKEHEPKEAITITHATANSVNLLFIMLLRISHHPYRRSVIRLPWLDNPVTLDISTGLNRLIVPAAGDFYRTHIVA